MLFAVFFGLLALFGGWITITSDGPFAPALASWGTANATLLAAAYALRRPSWVMGKGGPAWLRGLVVIDLPWLLLTWTTAWMLRRFGSEPAADRIGSTNIWIGRYPTRAEAASFEHVFDLTAEFPRSTTSAVLVPNLDGAPLTALGPVDLPRDGRILVHCAQGHGRSATWLAAQLVYNGLAADHPEALERIAAARPRARPSRHQRAQLA